MYVVLVLRARVAPNDDSETALGSSVIRGAEGPELRGGRPDFSHRFMQALFSFFFFSFTFLYVYLFLRDRETQHKQGRSREKGDAKSEAGSRLSAQSPTRGSDS